jgi:hypothetical protein
MAIYHISETEMLTMVGPGKVHMGGDAPVIGTVPQPEVSGLEPNTAACGDPDLQLVITGTGFNEMTKIVFNGFDEPTALLSPTQVRTNVKPSLFAVAVTLPVGVRTGSLKSNTLDFTFTDAGAARKRR